ncbi:hypothetical protein RSAG8_12190, partial [Rhizoctonia solani AG-8 WAC10335]
MHMKDCYSQLYPDLGEEDVIQAIMDRAPSEWEDPKQAKKAKAYFIELFNDDTPEQKEYEALAARCNVETDSEDSSSKESHPSESPVPPEGIGTEESQSECITRAHNFKAATLQNKDTNRQVDTIFFKDKQKANHVVLKKAMARPPGTSFLGSKATSIPARPVGMEYELQGQLTDEQREAFNKVLDSVNNDRGTTFFLDGPAGTGKTFLYRTLCYTLQAQDKIVLCVASSGLAALLLPGGKTSHSVFKIPIDVKDNSTCNIPKHSHLAALIAHTDLIIWDEVPMLDSTWG